MTVATGPICLVTGATAGIGRATALRLARVGATVIVMARDATRGAADVAEIRRASGNPCVDLLLCDLSSQAAIRTAAAELRQRYDRLHVLINNAALFTSTRRLTPDGLEMMFAVNHLAPFLLTHCLLDWLQQGAPARVITVTAPSTTRLNFDDLQGEQRFRALTAFGASKAANLLFTLALARRVSDRGITANAYHPGIVRSKLMQDATGPVRWVNGVMNRWARSPERAAEGLAQLAISAEFAPITAQLIHDGKPITNPFASDTTGQERLWAESLKLCGLEPGSPS